MPNGEKRQRGQGAYFRSPRGGISWSSIISAAPCAKMKICTFPGKREVNPKVLRVDGRKTPNGEGEGGKKAFVAELVQKEGRIDLLTGGGNWRNGRCSTKETNEPQSRDHARSKWGYLSAGKYKGKGVGESKKSDLVEKRGSG